MQVGYVSKHSLHKIGVGGLCVRNSEILLVKNTYGLSRGKWTLPGGYVELGETLSEAIEREVFEETGVQTRATSILALRHMNNEKKGKGMISDLYIVFKLEYIKGQPLSKTSETSESRFFSLKEIPDADISDLSKFIIEKITNTSEFFQLTYFPNEDIKTKLNIHNYQFFG